jgi:hypothetical protein
MTRFLLLGLAVTSLACGKKDRPHARVAELTTPVHVTVRTIDYPDKTPCVAAGPLERLKCWLAPARVGATYVEVGPAADLPMVTTGDIDSDLNLLLGRADTRTLLNRPVKKERVVIDCGETGMVVFLVGNSLGDMRLLWDELSGAPKLPNGELNWARVPRPSPPPLDLITTTRAELEALAKTAAGRSQIERAVKMWLSVDGDLDDANYVAALALLPEDVQRDRELEYLESVATGSTAARLWFERHPERQTPAYTDALLRSLDDTSWQNLELLTALVRLKPPGLTEKACAQVEQAFFSAATDWDFYLNTEAVGALAILAHERARCPWVLPLLDRVKCHDALTCLPPDAPVEPEDEDGRPRAGKALCTAEERRGVVERLFAESKGEDENLDLFLDEDPGWGWGAMLLTAAEAQGPLPAAFLKQTGRRGYLPVFRPPADEALDSCRDLYDVTPAQWACQVPANLSVSIRFGCRMEIDDVKKTLTLTSVAPPPAP